MTNDLNSLFQAALQLETSPTEEVDELETKPRKKKKEADINEHKHAQVLRTTQRHFERRVGSELALENELPWHFENGSTYHCISWGDVDSLTYLRVIVKQQKVKYLVISSWVMAITDAEEIANWLEKGYIDRVDFYLGEIFEKQYAGVYLHLKGICEQYGGRICTFKNHSKIMAGYGYNFDFCIESSANINTNPRTEQATITVGCTELTDFYKAYFDDVNSFNNDFPNWKKYIKE